MRLFYATRNESKIVNMRHRLKGYDVDVITPKDVGVYVDVDETGSSPTENAQLKARAYYDKTGIATIAGDSGLYIDGIPDERQPGIFVHRVNGKSLSESELIEHYTGLAAEYGGRLKARYVTGLSLIVEGREYHTEIPDDDMFLVGVPNENRQHRGNPLDVITICPANGKYMNDCSLHELTVLAGSFDRKCLQFLENNLLGL